MREGLVADMNTIRNLAVNPAQDRILATTRQSQIYQAHLLSGESPAVVSQYIQYCTSTFSVVLRLCAQGQPGQHGRV